MSAIIAKLEAEPVLVATFVGAVLNLGIAFGLPIDETQKAAILVVIDAVLAIFARQASTPVSAPSLPVGTAVNAGTATVTSTGTPPPSAAPAPAP